MGQRADTDHTLRLRARAVLMGLAAMYTISASLVVLLVSYPRTFGAWSEELALCHYITGDVAIGLSGLYVGLHLARVWRFKAFRTSRWTGFALVGLWFAGAATGVAWQLGFDLDAGAPEGGHTWLYHVHWLACLLSAVLAAGHGLYAFRPK